MISSLIQKAFAAALEKDPDSKAMLESRRAFLKQTAMAAGAMALIPSWLSAKTISQPRIAIIGAGIAGLNAACQLKKAGLEAQIYEASARTGGRMFSLHDKFGQGLSTDLGGEFVDTTHEDILELLKEFNLGYYDLRQEKIAHKSFYFGGRHRTEHDLRQALQPFIGPLVKDISALPARLDYTTGEQFAHIDKLSITEYIKGLGIDGWLYDFLNVVLTREYGMEASRQSAINFLIMFDSAPAGDGNYELFGAEHEVFKIKGGSQRLADAMVERIRSQVHFHHGLTGISQTSTNTYVLHFGSTKRIESDYVLMTIPFTILRGIEIDLPLSDGKRRSIHELGYGNSCKHIMGMSGRPWRDQGFQGYTFNDLSFGCGWDSSQLQPTSYGSFTVFGGGDNGTEIARSTPDALTKRYLPDLARTYPGAELAFTGKTVRFSWEQYPFTRAGYSSFEKGQWSTIAGYEAEPVGNVFFAGEHVSLDFQGYMNGAAKTGRIAAAAILEKIKVTTNDSIKT